MPTSPASPVASQRIADVLAATDPGRRAGSGCPDQAGGAGRRAEREPDPRPRGAADPGVARAGGPARQLRRLGRGDDPARPRPELPDPGADRAPAAAGRACRGSTDDDLARMREIQDAIEATDDVEEFLVLDRELHWTTYRRPPGAAARPDGRAAVGHHPALPARLHRGWPGGPRSWIIELRAPAADRGVERRDEPRQPETC